jgi:hypothetical protein
MFILYILCPFKIFNWKGRLYMWKIIGLCIISPLYQVNFTISFTTNQFVSLVNAIKDFAYTTCYYTQLDLKYSTSSSKCSGSIEVVFVAASIGQNGLRQQKIFLCSALLQHFKVPSQPAHITVLLLVYVFATQNILSMGSLCSYIIIIFLLLGHQAGLGFTRKEQEEPLPARYPQLWIS